MAEEDIVKALFSVGGFLIGIFGGKALPLLRTLASKTPTKVDDAVVELAQKVVDAEADCDKDK